MLKSCGNGPIVTGFGKIFKDDSKVQLEHDLWKDKYAAPLRSAACNGQCHNPAFTRLVPLNHGYANSMGPLQAPWNTGISAPPQLFTEGHVQLTTPAQHFEIKWIQPRGT